MSSLQSGVAEFDPVKFSASNNNNLTQTDKRKAWRSGYSYITHILNAGVKYLSVCWKVGESTYVFWSGGRVDLANIRGLGGSPKLNVLPGRVLSRLFRVHTI